MLAKCWHFTLKKYRLTCQQLLFALMEVQTVEQLGKEFNWYGAFKYSKVLEMIEEKVRTD
ncbi:hypothetical protein [Clostridium felsineum]|uniref:hypothetical protein n=1 Tax=Clostridium felsineum TaxID=36839 RepID=UPI0020341916|nr:hypothetical protein [Clostridium felsineum]